MKRYSLYAIALAILLPALSHGQTQTFYSIAKFATNVFLHDNATTPLHLRVPTNTPISGVTSTNGSATITTNAGVINVSVLAQRITATNTYLNPSDSNVLGHISFFVTNSFGGWAQLAANDGEGGIIRLGAAPSWGKVELSAAHSGADSYLYAYFYNSTGVYVNGGPLLIANTVDFATTNNFAAGTVTAAVVHATSRVTGNIQPTTGNAGTLTNFPASILTVSQGNTNYYRITTPPASNTAAGSFGQLAYNQTNIFIYHAASSKWLRVTGSLEW